jgi:CBS domain-containing protein
MQVREVLRVKGGAIFSVAPESKLSECVITMSDRDIGSVVVMEGDKLCGMLTFREVINVLAKRQKEQRVGPTPPIGDIKVSEAMDRKPFTSTPVMELDELRSKMLEHHARYVPILDGENVVGVISFHDVAKAVLEERNFENRMLKGYIKDWPAEEQA